VMDGWVVGRESAADKKERKERQEQLSPEKAWRRRSSLIEAGCFFCLVADKADNPQHQNGF
jgi:hypothetical protein